MDVVVLDDVAFDVEEGALMGLVRLRPQGVRADEFRAVLDEARKVARPKAACGIAEVGHRGRGRVDIGGVSFTSRLLEENLRDANAAFPYIATCGAELEEWAAGQQGALRQFWAENIMLVALGCAVGYLEGYLKGILGVEGLSSMNPGALDDWPIEQQATLFGLLGDAARSVGCRLAPGMVMRPLKSVSGIYFVSHGGFTNCSLCPRRSCASRRAAFNAALYARYRGG
ncbi:MAG TPA: hypothetical protein PLQ43_12620 [Deltaproteobacteria bacterium]|nr:hypothetical protein [Deltaproteobacteria bacterium]